MATLGAALAGAGLILISLPPASAATGTTPVPAAGQAVAVSSDGSSTLSLLYQAADHSLVHKGLYAGATTGLGGRLTSGPAAIAIGGTFRVFARGTDNAVWTRTRSQGIWSPWTSLGGRSLGAPTVSGSGASTNAPIIWVRGTDGALWQRSVAGGTWQSLGGKLTSDPAAVPAIAGSYPPGRDLFALGADHAVWEYTSGWHKVGGQSTVAPAAAWAPVSGATLLLARGTDNALWMAARPAGASTFGGFTKAGGRLSSPPAATIFPSGGPSLSMLSVLALGQDGNVWAATWKLSGGPWMWQLVP